MPEKPYSEACVRNREPILAVLRRHFADRQRVLEIGSGTGQHALHFAAALPQLQWQTSDRADYLDGIRAWLAEAALANTPPPLTLDVNGAWPDAQFDAAFGANSLHIMSWAEVQKTFDGLATVLTPHAKLAIYGPFNYGGAFTSDSNAAFDAALKARAAQMGIRDVEAVQRLAADIGLQLIEDVAMPANNRCLVWQRA
ncbi:MAG: putative S-adenosylmethionine-dependent methyltransferase [Nevskia sp.]|nr:putative S-adenosylmethionine-dependent methyltransferase [Nevskia sp.]